MNIFQTSDSFGAYVSNCFASRVSRIVRGSATFMLAAALPLLMSTGLLTNAQDDVTDTVKRTFDVRPGGTAHVEIDVGKLVVRSHAGSTVEMIVERTVDVDDEDKAREILQGHELEMSRDGDNVYLTSEFSKQGGIWKWFGGSSDNDIDVAVELRVPSRYNVEFEAGAGNVSIEDIRGDLTGETGAGNISVKRVNGAISVSSGAGNVALSDVGGALEVETGAGNIAVEIGSRLTGDSALHSGMGNVSVRIASSVGADIEASTGMGSLDTDFDLKQESAWMSGSASGVINGGGPSLELNTGMGSISLRKM